MASEIVTIPEGQTITVTETTKSPGSYIMWHRTGLFIVSKDDVTLPIRIISLK